MATVYPFATDGYFAKQRGVRNALRDQANEIEARAKGLRAQHYVTGAAKIEHTRGALDHFVSLVDKAALSIEFGHMSGNTYVEGLHIIGRAAKSG